MPLKVRRTQDPIEIHWDALVISIGIALAIGFLGSLATVGAIPTWYAGLHKPFFTPPNSIFGPVWTLLYIAMALSAYLVWVKYSFRPKAQSFYTTYALQLALNFGWSLVFFGAHNIRLSMLIIAALWYVIYRLITLANKLTPVAAYLLYPYLAWVSFATLLNLGIVILN